MFVEISFICFFIFVLYINFPFFFADINVDFCTEAPLYILYTSYYSNQFQPAQTKTVTNNVRSNDEGYVPVAQNVVHIQLSNQQILPSIHIEGCGRTDCSVARVFPCFDKRTNPWRRVSARDTRMPFRTSRCCSLRLLLRFCVYVLLENVECGEPLHHPSHARSPNNPSGMPVRFVYYFRL